MAVHLTNMEGSSPSPKGQLGRYQQVATLGQGGMGTVYLALASGFGQFRKLLVVKELRQDLTRQKGFIRLFMDEAKLAARLSHPNVVQTFEAFQEGNRYLLAMEYLDGQSLSALIVRAAREQPPRLTLGMHIHILCEVLSGLHYAHQLRDYDGTNLHVVHRDVSPQNVFVTYHGEVKVVDFGVAKAANAATSTAPGIFVGKFGYAAPEQVLGRPVDARTDVFAVGVMLWQAISQRRFSTGSPTPEAFRARAEGREPRIRDVVPDVDSALADICDRAMAVDPADRYATAEELRAALLGYLESMNTRFHDSELGQLMQETFEQERRSLHAQIEAAVQASGTESNVESLSFLTVDKEPTAVADLSNLVDVSLQREDHKIRAAYANTKVTRRPSQSSSLAVPDASSLATGLPEVPGKSRPWLWAAAALAVAIAGAVLYGGSGDDEARIDAKPLPASSAATLGSAAPNVAPRRVTPRPPAHVASPSPPKLIPPAAKPPPAAPKPSPSAPSSAVSRAPAPRSSGPSSTRRSRPKEAPTPVRVERPAPPAPPAPEAAPPAPAQPARVEAGADLGNARRIAPARIDLENPYQ